MFFSSRYSSVSSSSFLCFSRPPTLFLPGVWLSLDHQFHSCGASSVFPQLFQPVYSRLIRHSSSLSFSGALNSSFFLSWSHSFPWIKCSPCSFASRQFIIPEFGRHLRRFIGVQINSRLSPHSNILIVPVHHLSLQQSFPTVFFSSVGPNPHVFSQDLTELF